jgi:hypothetical protein
MHTGYSIQFAHAHAEGICVNPVAAKAPQNASIVRLHAPFEMLTVYWSACSLGKPPICPSYKSFFTNQNRLFIGGERYAVCTPDLVGHIWQAAGRLEFSVVAPEGLDSDFGLAKCPWEGTPLDQALNFYLPSGNFKVGIIKPDSPLPAGIKLDPDVGILNLQMGVPG